MVLFCQKKKNVYNSVKVLESPGIRNFFGGNHENCIIWDRLQNLLLILGEFKRINWLLFSQKSSEKLLFSGDSMGNKSLLIHLNSLNIRSEIWRRNLAL